MSDDDALVGADGILYLVAESQVTGDQDSFPLRCEGENLVVFLAAQAVIPNVKNLVPGVSQDFCGGSRKVLVDDELQGSADGTEFFFR